MQESALPSNWCISQSSESGTKMAVSCSSIQATRACSFNCSTAWVCKFARATSRVLKRSGSLRVFPMRLKMISAGESRTPESGCSCFHLSFQLRVSSSSLIPLIQ